MTENGITAYMRSCPGCGAAILMSSRETVPVFCPRCVADLQPYVPAQVNRVLAEGREFRRKSMRRARIVLVLLVVLYAVVIVTTLGPWPGLLGVVCVALWTYRIDRKVRRVG